MRRRTRAARTVPTCSAGPTTAGSGEPRRSATMSSSAAGSSTSERTICQGGVWNATSTTRRPSRTVARYGGGSGRVGRPQANVRGDPEDEAVVGLARPEERSGRTQERVRGVEAIESHGHRIGGHDPRPVFAYSSARRSSAPAAGRSRRRLGEDDRADDEAPADELDRRQALAEQERRHDDRVGRLDRADERGLGRPDAPGTAVERLDRDERGDQADPDDARARHRPGWPAGAIGWAVTMASPGEDAATSRSSSGRSRRPPRRPRRRRRRPGRDARRRAAPRGRSSPSR